METILKKTSIPKSWRREGRTFHDIDDIYDILCTKIDGNFVIQHTLTTWRPTAICTRHVSLATLVLLK